jgi:hypothetical protein
VQLGEREGVHQGRLVESNASEGVWYRQARAVVASAWALPYNSAYDYGAWDNAVGAVLNGRFVGVEPLAGVDSDLLGAALNSTFAIIGRLLEGTATGVEAAFDVGPPAVRRIRIPDVRRLTPEAVEEVGEVLAQMRREDTTPAAPLRTLAVSPLRQRLDTALLRGLGRTAGQAAALVGEMYQSYARWRADVEDVEQLMRQNRRQMSRSGQSRTVRPAEQVGRRVWEELQGTLPLYPTGLLTHGDVFDSVAVPRGVTIPLSEPLFDAGMVHVDGGRGIDLGAFERVRYVGVLRAVGFESPLEVLRDARKAGAIADRFERDRRAFLAEARRRVAGYISDADAVAEAVTIAERHWLQASRAAGMRLPTAGGKSVAAAPPVVLPALTPPVAGRSATRRRRR